MANFREDIFISALSERTEDALRMSALFEPEWLENRTYQHILREIYAFSVKQRQSPSIPTLREIFQDRDQEEYSARYKEAFDRLQNQNFDTSHVILTLDKAKNVAMTRSLVKLLKMPEFAAMQEKNDGQGQMGVLHEWIQKFSEDSECVEMNLKEAVDKLIADRLLESDDDRRIPCGISVIDDWSAGGLKRKQLAILMAPSGNGKSVALGIIAHSIAAQMEKRVLYISNELTSEEVTERFLSRLTGESITRVMKDPTLGRGKLERHWSAGMHHQLRMVEVFRQVDTNYIDALVARYRTVFGWKPDVIVIDYMERMKPCDQSIRQRETWLWNGAIAKDLVWASKRGNYLIWTAIQTNRSGYNKEVEQGVAQAQGSIQHIQEATMVVAMRKTQGKTHNDQYPETLQFKPLKVRHNKDGEEAVYIRANLGKMVISDERVSASEVIGGKDAGQPPMKKDDEDD